MRKIKFPSIADGLAQTLHDANKHRHELESRSDQANQLALSSTAAEAYKQLVQQMVL